MKKTFVALVGLIGVIAVWSLYFRQPVRLAHEKDGDTVLVVGTNAEYPPFSFTENNAIVGFDIDIIREVCKRLGLTLQLKDMSFDILIPKAQQGSIDLIAAGMTPTPERSRELLFTDLYFTGDPLVIVSPSQHPLKTIAELIGVSVVVNDGYTADLFMTGIAGIDLKRLPTPAGAFLALEAGRADAYVTAQSTVSSFLRQNVDKSLSIVAIPNTEEKYAFALSPRRSDLLSKINTMLKDFKKEGLLQKLKEKWELSHD